MTKKRRCSATQLTHKTCDSGDQTGITLQKANQNKL